MSDDLAHPDDQAGNAKSATSKRAAKAPGAFRTISEVAEELSVPQHVLRFWESKFSQVRPLKRGGGRRYYRPEDVTLLRQIRRLLYDEGYKIRGVQKVLREGGRRVAPDGGPEGAGKEAGDGAGAALENANGALDRDQRRQLSKALEELNDIRDTLRQAGG